VGDSPLNWRAQQDADNDFDPAPAGSTSHAKSIRARCASAIANSGGRTPCSRAHAIRSASEWQQHDRQHCSAVAHPQAHSEHGNNSPLFVATLPVGSGTPDAVAKYIASNAAVAQRWRTEAVT